MWHCNDRLQGVLGELDRKVWQRDRGVALGEAECGTESSRADVPQAGSPLCCRGICAWEAGTTPFILVLHKRNS